MSGLPISWLNTHLEDLITLEMGQAPAGSKCNKTGNGTPFVKAGEFGSTHPVIREWTTNPLRYGKQGDVFLCVVGATSGKINYGIECAIGRSVAALRPYLGLETHFLYHFLSTRIMHLRSGTAGSAQGVISKSDINFISIPLPPLAEQRRIVAKIEELFSELDAGEESLRRAQRQLGVYRQSLLKQAFEGKLTEPWRKQNPHLLEDPEQLLERIQAERQARYEEQMKEWEAASKQSLKKPLEKKPAKPKAPGAVLPLSNKLLEKLPNLPKGWIWQVVENLVDHGRSCAYGVLIPGPHVESGIPLVRVGDIQNGRVSMEDMKRVSPQIVRQYRRTELQGGEFLITLVGAIGRTAVVQPELKGANTARAVGVVPLSKVINPHFVEVCFRSPSKLAEMGSQANEVARKTLNLEDVRKATVPLCSLPEQQEIVRLLDEQFTVIEQNEREIDAALKRSAALRQSILKNAFTGQLVPQDPTDEPASALLERIREERASGSQTRKGVKKALDPIRARGR